MAPGSDGAIILQIPARCCDLLPPRRIVRTFERRQRSKMCVKKSAGLTSQFKDFFARRLLLCLLPEGCSAFARTLCWIFLNSLWRVLQKSALIPNKITASKIRTIRRGGNKYDNLPYFLYTRFQTYYNFICIKRKKNVYISLIFLKIPYLPILHTIFLVAVWQKMKF